MANNIHKIVVEADTSQAIAEMQKLSNAMKNYGLVSNKSVVGSNSTMASSFSSLSSVTSKFGLILSGAGIVTGLLALGKAAITSSSQVEQIAVSFEVFTGSAEVAKNMLTALKDQALKSPMQFQDITKGAQTLLGYGLTAEQVIPVTKMLGDVSGGNADKFARLALAFGQVNAAGRLMGQEARQMINAGFNPLQAIADKTGKSMAQLTKDMKNGKISVQEVADAFTYATSEGGRFYGMAEKQSQTVGGALNKLSESLFFVTAELGAYGAKTLDLQGAISGLSNFFTYLANTFKPILDNFKQGTALGGLLSKAFDILKGSIIIIVGIIDGLLIAFNKLGDAATYIYDKFASKFPRLAKIVEGVYNVTIGLVAKLGNEISKDSKIDNVTESISSMKKEIESLQKLRETQILINPMMVDVTSKKIAKLKADIAILEKTTAKGDTRVTGFSTQPTGVDGTGKVDKVYERLAEQARLGFTNVNKQIRTGFETKLDIFDRYAKEELDALKKYGLATYKVEASQYKLRQELATVELQKLSSIVNKNTSLQGLKDSMSKMFEKQSEKFSDIVAPMDKSISNRIGGTFDYWIKNIASDAALFNLAIDELVYNDNKSKVATYAQSMYSALNDFSVNLYSGFANLAGSAIAGIMSFDDAIARVGSMFMNLIGDLLIQMGTSAIKLGVSSEAIQAALAAIGLPGGGAAAIAVGTLAVAAGSLLKSMASKTDSAIDANAKSTTDKISKKASTTSGMTSGSSYQYGGSSYATQSIKLSIDLTGAITASPTGYNINKSLETVLRVTGR